MKYLFEDYKKKKGQTIKNPIYERYIAFKETEELTQERSYLEKSINKHSKFFLRFITLEMILLIIGVITISIFISVLQERGSNVFNSFEVIYILIAILAISISIILVPLHNKKSVLRNAKFKIEIEPTCENIDNLVKEQIDFKDSDILFSLNIDVLVPKCKIKRGKVIIKKSFKIKNILFILTSDKFYLDDHKNFIEIPRTSFIDIKEITKTIKLPYWPNYRAYNSEKYKKYAIKCKDNEFYLRYYCVIELAGDEGIYNIAVMPYEKQKIIIFFKTLEMIINGKYVTNSTNLTLLVENCLTHSKKALLNLKKEYFSQKCKKITILGLCSDYFIEELLESKITVDYIYPTVNNQDVINCHFNNYDKVQIINIDDYNINFEDEQNFIIITPFVLEDDVSEKYIKILKECCLKAKHIAILKNNFFNSSAVNEVDILLSEKFNDYYSIRQRKSIFNNRIKEFENLFELSSFKEKFSLAFIELKYIFLNTLELNDLNKEIYDNILKQIFTKYSFNNILEILYETNLFIKKQIL